jgi:hypothetical protein
MPIVSGDIKYYLSGGAGNSDPNAALGGIISATEVSATALNNIFDNVSGAESTPGESEYRGIYVKNTHGTLTLQSAKLWLESEVASGANISIALADEGLNATMETIANEDTAPSGPSFSAPTTKAAGLLLGNIPNGQYYGFWIKRTVPPATGAQAADGVTLRVEGDTDA